MSNFPHSGEYSYTSNVALKNFHEKWKNENQMGKRELARQIVVDWGKSKKTIQLLLTLTLPKLKTKILIFHSMALSWRTVVSRKHWPSRSGLQ